MNETPSEYLFGEEKTINNGVSFSMKTFAGFYIGLFVLVVSFAVSASYFSSVGNLNPSQEVLGESISVYKEVSSSSIDILMKNLLNSNYKVEGNGAFGYIYEESEKGVVSLENSVAYFEFGELVMFDLGNGKQVLWDQWHRKFVLDEEKKEYFLVTNKHDFYHREYLGQYILNDFIRDYSTNKDFIFEKEENLWSWQWSFYTSVDEYQKYTIDVEIVGDLEKGILREFRLLNDGEILGVFEFSFEEYEEKKDVEKIFNDYEEVDFSFNALRIFSFVESATTKSSQSLFGYLS